MTSVVECPDCGKVSVHLILSPKKHHQRLRNREGWRTWRGRLHCPCLIEADDFVIVIDP